MSHLRPTLTLVACALLAGCANTAERPNASVLVLSGDAGTPVLVFDAAKRELGRTRGEEAIAIAVEPGKNLLDAEGYNFRYLEVAPRSLYRILVRRGTRDILINVEKVPPDDPEWDFRWSQAKLPRPAQPDPSPGLKTLVLTKKE